MFVASQAGMISRAAVCVLVCSISYVVAGYDEEFSDRFSEIMFRLDPDPSLGLVSLDTGWQDWSASSCARSCLTKYKNCRSFLFDRATNFCTPGSNVIRATTNKTTGDLYHSFLCDSNKGFTVYKHLNVTVCIGFFGPPMNFTDADAACREKDGFLMTVKISYESRILRDHSYVTTWIGLDDIAVEGSFHYKEDGSELMNSTKTNLFCGSGPNNLNGDEDCVAIDTDCSSKLNDRRCNETFPYACQIPTLLVH